MDEDKRTHWVVVQTGAQLAPTVRNTEAEARRDADMMVRTMGAREVGVYKLVVTYRAEPVVVVVDADPNTDGRGTDGY